MRRRRQRRRRLLGTALLAVGLPAASAIGWTVLLVAPWRVIAPPTSSFILHYEGEPERTARQRWVDFEDISPQLALAVIAAEDQKFPVHHGFDFASIRKVLLEDQSRGASTITQQVAKNLYLWPERSWLRKGLEAWLTGFLELLWPKRRILEVYLNVAEFGPGIYGAEAASRHFFGRPAVKLTAGQAARLAAVLPSPRRMSAGNPSRHVRERESTIRGQMRRLGGIAFLESLQDR